MARIAVVDDVAVNRELFAVILKQFGHVIDEADSGSQGLELVRRTRPDLIICDIVMPEMDGYDFVRTLRADPFLAGIPVIFCTAHFLEKEAQALAEACGVRAVLTKPIEPQHALQTARGVLAGAAQAPPDGEPVIDRDFDRQHLQLISDKLSQKVTELQSVNDKLEALIELNLQLASERNKGSLLAHICVGARQLIGSEFGTVAVREADSESLAFVKHCGIDPALVAQMGPIRLDCEPFRPVYREAQTLRLNIRPDRQAAAGLPSGYPQVRNLLVAPVKSLAATYGWICLANKREPGGFTEGDAALLQILAAQSGRIYENGSLYARLRQYAQELERGIVERDRAHRHLAAQFAVTRVLNEASCLEAATPLLLQAIGSELGMEAATLWRVDDYGEHLRCVDVWSYADESCRAFVEQSRRMSLVRDMGVPGAAWASGQPLWFADLRLHPGFLRAEAAHTAGLVSGGAVPIMVGGRVIGVVDVFSRRRCELDERLADTLSTLAVQIGQFLERIAQQQRILRLTRVYAVLSGINSAIVRIHDRARLFREACRIAVKEGEFGIAWIGEVDASTEEVKPVAWAGVDDDIGAEPLSVRSDLELGQGAVGEAVRSAEPCVIDELDELGAVGKRREEALRRGYRSLIALPLIVDGRVVGVLVLYAREPGFFNEEEQELLTELANDISFALEYIAKQDLLAYLAYHDVLTGLPNRAHLLDRLAVVRQVARHHRDDCIAVVLWDIDRFLNINDTFGRQVGDSVLRELARRLRAAWPDEGDVARLSVDQFGALLGGAFEPADIAHLVERTTAAVLDRPFVLAGEELRIALTAGVSLLCRQRDDDADAMLSNAEAALRKARASGAGYLFYGPEMNAQIAETLLLENKLRRALENDELLLHYQPKVCGNTGRLRGFEALLRWQEPGNGLVPPARFIPILEETGLIVPAGLLAIRRALTDIAAWQAEGLELQRVAVNVSPLQLQRPDFVASLRQIFDEHKLGVPPLDLEITESMIMSDMEGNVARLTELRDMGLEIAVDDFGTGYSSLAYLARLPVSALKVDRSFVATMTAAPESMTIVNTIISLAHALDLKVVAEGVENAEQARLLRLLKCDMLQGFLISRPLPPDQVPAFVRSLTAAG